MYIFINIYISLLIYPAILSHSLSLSLFHFVYIFFSSSIYTLLLLLFLFSSLPSPPFISMKEVSGEERSLENSGNNEVS